MRTILWLLLTLFLANLLWNGEARAQSDYYGFSQRAQKRESTRWTLSEWLAQRDRNRMMDLWLSMNSPSPYEFMLGVSSLNSKTTVDAPASEQSYNRISGEVRAYAQFVGLTMEYENNAAEKFNDLSGMLNIRLFGDSLQNSSLTVHVGQRTRTMDFGGASVALRNLFEQASLQLHLAKSFGIDASYRRFEPFASDGLNATVSGNQTEAGLFIDFKAVRVFGAWVQERQLNEDASTTAITTTTREGIKAGLKIYY